MANLKKGKVIVQAVIKEDIMKKLDEIADQEFTSRSNIAGKIIHENIDKYIIFNKKEEVNSMKTATSNVYLIVKDETTGIEKRIPIEYIKNPMSEKDLAAYANKMISQNQEEKK